MGLGFGLLSAQTRPGETNWSRPYEQTLRLAAEAERLGFTSLWTTEHHFVDDGYMPSLLVVSAAIATVTKSIEVGTGVVLAPLHHPLRLAEDAATVDLLSSERLTLGLGLGWSTTEFAGLGADIHRRGAAMDEVLEILPKAWSGGPFRHRGSVYDLPELAVRPVPNRPIPIVIGGGAEPAIRRAARLADGIFANVPDAEFMRQVLWVKDEMAKVGRDPAGFRFIHYSVMLPGDTEESALERGLPHLWQMMWKYSDMEASTTRTTPPPEAPPLTAEARDRLFARSTVAGTGEQIVEKLLGIRERAGVDVEFTARSFFPTMSDGDQLEIMEHLAEEVAPHL